MHGIESFGKRGYSHGVIVIPICMDGFISFIQMIGI